MLFNRLSEKIIFILFCFIILNPLFSEPLIVPEEDNELEEWVFFLEELFISFEELIVDEGTFLSENLSLAEELFINQETVIEEPIIISEETIPDEVFIPEAEIVLTDEETPLEEEAETAASVDEFDDFDDFEYLTSLLFEGNEFVYEVPEFETRSFYDVFPSLTIRQRRLASSTQGIRHYFTKNDEPEIIPNPELEVDLLSKVMKCNPSHLIEALVLVPYKEKEYDLLDIYNAIGRIEKIKDQSVVLNGNDFYIFTESTRIESTRNRKAVSDPLPATMLPFSDSMHIRLKEISLGNLFLRGDVSVSMYGLTYSMTNFVDVRYFIVPVVRTERFLTILYLEPVKEGVLIYSMTGFYMPDFIADRVNLTPNINRRIQIFIDWIKEGLRESAAAF